MIANSTFNIFHGMIKPPYLATLALSVVGIYVFPISAHLEIQMRQPDFIFPESDQEMAPPSLTLVKSYSKTRIWPCGPQKYVFSESS
jgi:hypothetical protein